MLQSLYLMPHTSCLVPYALCLMPHASSATASSTSCQHTPITPQVAALLATRNTVHQLGIVTNQLHERESTYLDAPLQQPKTKVVQIQSGKSPTLRDNLSPVSRIARLYVTLTESSSSSDLQSRVVLRLEILNGSTEETEEEEDVSDLKNVLQNAKKHRLNGRIQRLMT